MDHWSPGHVFSSCFQMNDIRNVTRQLYRTTGQDASHDVGAAVLAASLIRFHMHSVLNKSFGTQARRHL